MTKRNSAALNTILVFALKGLRIPAESISIFWWARVEPDSGHRLNDAQSVV